MAGAFWGTRVLEIVRRNDSPGLLWKRIKLTTTRKANAKKRLRRVWQDWPDSGRSARAADSVQIGIAWADPIISSMNEAVLRACAEPLPAKGSSVTSTTDGEVGSSS